MLAASLGPGPDSGCNCTFLPLNRVQAAPPWHTSLSQHWHILSWEQSEAVRQRGWPRAWDTQGRDYVRENRALQPGLQLPIRNGWASVWNQLWSSPGLAVVNVRVSHGQCLR